MCLHCTHAFDDALFASALQRSDELSISNIRNAVAAALLAYGPGGCARRVAQEFGDHPETAVVRMRWARATVAVVPEQSAASMRRIAADCSTAGRNQAPTGLSAIRSA
jgi:hypothetical protein